MTTTALYQAAVADMEARKERYGVARQAIPGAGELICSIKRVAGRSVVKGHYRTNWLFLKAGEQYSKEISRDRAVEILRTPETVN